MGMWAVKEDYGKDKFLKEVSIVIFAFCTSQVLLHLHGWGMIVTYPRPTIKPEGLFVLSIVIVSSVFYLLYWWSDRIQSYRKIVGNKHVFGYLIVGAADCINATLPYLGYVFAIHMKDFYFCKLVFALISSVNLLCFILFILVVINTILIVAGYYLRKKKTEI